MLRFTEPTSTALQKPHMNPRLLAIPPADHPGGTEVDRLARLAALRASRSPIAPRT